MERYLRDHEERERSCESCRQREGEGVGAGRGGVWRREEEMSPSPWYIRRKFSPALVGVAGADSGKVRSMRQEKEGVGEGERRGEGMDICGGERGEACTGLMPLMEGGRVGGVGWGEGVATTSCTSSRGWSTCGGGAGWSGCRRWRPTTCLARFLFCRPRRLLNLGIMALSCSLKAADIVPCLAAAGASGFLNSGSSGGRGTARGEEERLAWGAAGGAGRRSCLGAPPAVWGRPTGERTKPPLARGELSRGELRAPRTLGELWLVLLPRVGRRAAPARRTRRERTAEHWPAGSSRRQV